jgi:hypothetical protein
MSWSFSQKFGMIKGVVKKIKKKKNNSKVGLNDKNVDKHPIF